MADTIRDVIVKVRMQVERSEDLRKQMEQIVGPAAERAASAQARRATETKKKAAEEQIKLVRESAEKERKLEEEKQKKISETEKRFREIRMKERLAAYRRGKEEEARIEAEKEAEKSKGVFGAAKSTWGFAARTLARVAAATIIVEHAEGFVKGIADAIRKEREGKVGDDGPITEWAKGLLNAADQMREVFSDTAKEFGGKAGSAVYEFFMGSAIAGILEPARRAGAIEGKVTRKIGGKETESLEGRIKTERELQQILMERTKAERTFLELEKQRIESAREEFGLLDQSKRENVMDIAKKIRDKGIGALSPEDADFVRGNAAFRGIFSDQAKAQADAAGFGELLKILGIDKKLAEAEAKIKTEVKNVIDINIDPANLAKSLEERLAPMLREAEEKQLRQILTLIEKTKKEMANANNIGF